VQYDYAGRLTNMSWLTEWAGYGISNSTSESRTYNANGQLASIGWSGSLTLQYNYSATQNNGQITQEVDSYPYGQAVTTTSYQYDPLKRLTSAAMTQTGSSGITPWTQTYQYDGFGNLTQKVLNGTSTPIPVNAATNRLTNAYYDANGNMTSGAGATLTYDEANRVTTATETSGGEAFYGYDPSNKRIYSNVSGGEMFTFYGAKGENLGKYAISTSSCYPYSFCFVPQVTNLWFGGRLVATMNYSQQPSPVFQDRLGTNRATGTYHPYGDGIAGYDTLQFATYTRDSYTGLDYADQRFYASTYGRFNTPDPARNSAVLLQPSSWNRYEYVYDDPVNRLDPSGLTSCDANGNNCYDSVTVTPDDGVVSVDLASAIYPTNSVPKLPTPPRYTAYQLYNLGLDLAPSVNGTTYTNCQALGDYAGAAAFNNNSPSQFVYDFRNLNPDAVPNDVTLYNGGDNGFQAQFQNTVNDLGVAGNGDQAHHFAYFLQLGFQSGSSSVASLAALVLEQYEALQTGSVVNTGDVALGIAAAQIGANLRNGTESIQGAVGDIRGLCK
jgi:RHS repeat-associated protein